MLNKYLIVVLTFLICVQALPAQDYSEKGFQRLYDLDNTENMLNISNTSTGKNYISLDYYTVIENNELKSRLTITSFDEYGSLGDNSIKMKIDSINGSEIMPRYFDGDVMYGLDKNIYSGTMVDFDNKAALLLTSSKDTVNWSYMIDVKSSICDLDNFDTNGFVLSFDDLDANNLNLMTVEYNNALVGSTVNGTLADTFGFDYTVYPTEVVAEDSTKIYLVGAAENFANFRTVGYFIAFDKDLNPLATRSINTTGAFTRINYIDRIGDEFAISGELDNGAFVAKIDTLGQPIWVKKWKLNTTSHPQSNTTITGQATNADGDLFLAGLIIDTGSSDTTLYISKVDASNGTITQISLLNETNPSRSFSQLSENGDNGVLYSSAFNQGTLMRLGLMQMTQDGHASFCDEIVTVDPLEDLSMATDTLLVTVSEGKSITPVEVSTSPFDISATSLISSSYEFCPHEEIDTLIGEFYEDAVHYNWVTTGETTDTIRVMEVGKYVRVVSFGKDYCYNLSDTTPVERISQVRVDLIPGPIDCVNKLYTYSFKIEDGRPPYQHLWSDQTTGNTIMKGGNEEFSIEVTDACGDMATEMTTTKSFASDGVAIVVLEDCKLSTSPSNFKSHLWNTGDNTPIINIMGETNFSVTVTDECEDTATASYTLEAMQWPNLFMPVQNAEILFEDNKTFGPFLPCTGNPESYTLRIYNRWGQEIFMTNDINQRWDGKLKNGDDAPVDSYIYHAVYNFGDGEQSDQGSVIIFR